MRDGREYEECKADYAACVKEIMPRRMGKGCRVHRNGVRTLRIQILQRFCLTSGRGAA